MELSSDNEVGRIVWVRRKNGSWWPGKILGGEELSASDLMSPRPGTPIKYLGRKDASVDWFNLEKSKRVKPFRCSEFDDCIQRAQASQGMRPKKQQKYACRVDAILDALQLEKQFLHKKYPNLQTPVPLNCQPSNNHNDDDDIYDADQIEFIPKVFGRSETEDESMSDADESDESLPTVSKWKLKGKRNTRSLMKDTSASESVSVTVGQLPSELGTKLTDSEVDATTIDELQEKPGTTLPKTIIDFAVQCHTCRKWRKLETEEHFEEFRSKHTKDRFKCNKLPGTTCEDTTNIMNYDSSRVWAMDKPNIPKTPQGFKRIVSLRNDCSKLDVQYLTPQKKKIRSGVEMAFFLDKHPEFKDLSPSDFCFMAPKLTPDTVPKFVVQDQASDTVPNIA